MKIKIVKPEISKFRVVDGKDAWKEVVYSARVSGVPESVSDEDCFKMIVRNDYGSALEHIIIKFDIKMTKGNAPELLEHRIASHTGYSTRYIKADEGFDKEKGYEIIVPWHLINSVGKKKFDCYYITGNRIKFSELLDTEIAMEFARSICKSLEMYEQLLKQGVPRESARYVLPFCLAVGIYHMTWNLRSLLNLLSLRLCVRASPEFRCIASQIYFNLVEQLPVLRGLVGCRGFMRGVCPEEGVTGVRVGKQHPVYPPCPFRNPKSDSYIPTMKELRDGLKEACNNCEHNHDSPNFFNNSGKGLGVKTFNSENAVEKMEKLFRRWAEWKG